MHGIASRLSPVVASLFVLALGCSGGGELPIDCDPACAVGFACDTVSGQCVPGEVDAGAESDAGGPAGCQPMCAAPTPFCDAQKRCVACMKDGDCPNGAVCRSGLLGNACVPGCADDSRCQNGQKCCAGACTDVTKDILHCGGCGMACASIHARAACVAGKCEAGSCDAGWGDCNNDGKDGCETNLKSNTDHCTACGMKCAIAHAVNGCAGGCYMKACVFGFDDCNADDMDGCETDVSEDPRNCGACGNNCSGAPNARVACVNSICGVAGCLSAFLDCDGDGKNGCEVNGDNDAKNCGACGIACPQGLICKGSRCTCPMCNIPNAASKCVNNVCLLDQCNVGYANCDGNDMNGCEVNIGSDAKNCGACGNVCPNNTPYCYQGKCTTFTLFPNANYTAAVSFRDLLPGTTMGITFDGKSYWSCSGGGPGGDRLAQYDGNGNKVGIYQPNIDFRAVLTKNGNTAPVYERGFSSAQIQVMGNPGQFGGGIGLQGGNLDAQSSVAFDDTGNELIAFNSGTVTRWNSANGALIGTLALQGYGANNENQYPQNRGIAKARGYYLTYFNGTLSAWTAQGVREKTTVLTGAGNGFDSHFSLSYCNGMVFVVDMAGGTWRGYNVGL